MGTVEPTLPAVPAGSAPGEKGLKGNALGLVSSIVIGVASTAPGYSLAASLGLVVAAVGLQSPAIMWVTFIPMLLRGDVVLLPEPRRPGLRHDVLLGDEGLRPVGRLARRLGGSSSPTSS